MPDPRVRLVEPASGQDADRVLTALDSVRIVVQVGPLGGVAAAAAAAFVALCARLFAHVEVHGRAAMCRNAWGVTDVADVLPALTLVRPAPACDPAREMIVALGDTGADADLAVGGGAWSVTVTPGRSEVDEAGIAGHGHALGLHAAAALAVNELMKTALIDVGMTAVRLPASGLTWNLLDYRLFAPESASASAGAGAGTAGRVLFAGCGSVGSSVIALLSMSPGLTGQASLADPEPFDPDRNPFRYPALLGEETERKTAWAATVLREAGWAVDGLADSVRDWIAAQPQPGFDGLVVSSVDEIPGRLEVADVLARHTCSIGVAGLAMHVQQEQLGDSLACPFCDFASAAPPLTEAHVTAQQLGLSVDRVIALHLPGSTLDHVDVAAAVAAGALHPDSAAGLIGHRLGDLIARSYAEVGVGRAPGVAGIPTQVTVAVAAPQVSWLAGVLAAAEVAKYMAGLPMVERRVDVDLTGLPQGFTRRSPADPTGSCVCASPHRRRWMGRMYGT